MPSKKSPAKTTRQAPAAKKASAATTTKRKSSSRSSSSSSSRKRSSASSGSSSGEEEAPVVLTNTSRSASVLQVVERRRRPRQSSSSAASSGEEPESPVPQISTPGLKLISPNPRRESHKGQQHGLSPSRRRRWVRIGTTAWFLFFLLSSLYLFWAPAWGLSYGMVLSLSACLVAATRLGWSTVAQRTRPIGIPSFAAKIPVVRTVLDVLSNPVHRWFPLTPTFVVLVAATGILLGCSLDSTFRLVLWDGYEDVELTRIGAVDSTSAKVWLRYPPPQQHTAKPFALRLFYREAGENGDGEWQGAATVSLNSSFDWTSVVALKGLKPDMEYEYSWMFQQKLAYFSASGRRDGKSRLNTGKQSQTDEDRSLFRFRTAQAHGKPSKFSFVFGSCIKPNVPYGTGVRGFASIARHVPDFLLFLGDFIYVDFSIRLGSSVSHYRKLYREVLGHPESAKLLGSTPSIGIFDDHEIINDWDQGNTVQPYPAATMAFRNYLASANPSHTSDNKTFFYTFVRGNNAFFMMDTRSYRKGTDKNGTSLSYDDPRRTMLGSQQLAFLFNWLNMAQSQGFVFKFLITSVPMTYNWRNADTWYGYQHERQRILDYIHRNGIENVVFLSGDRHQVAVTEFEFKSASSTNKARRSPVVEFSVSPINQFGIPFHWHFETENSKEGPVHFPNSAWARDRKLYYNHSGAKVLIGRVFVDTTQAKPRLIFCTFGEAPEENKDAVDCGGRLGSKSGKPLYRYELEAVVAPKRP